MILDDIGEAGFERLFYNLLLRVGALGKYQYISLIIWSIPYMLAASVIFFNPLLFYQAPYNCADLNASQCDTHVCSLPQELRNPYLPHGQDTLIDRFGDYRCENKSQLKFLQSIIYISGTAGIILSIYLSSFIRKKLLVEICVLVSAICFCLILKVENLAFLVVLLCINYTAQSIVSDLAVCFLVETVLEEERGNHMTILFVFYSVGCMLNGILFKLISWQNVLIFYFIIPLILSFIAIKWYIKETPFDLVTNFTPEEAYRDFHWIAEQNGNADNHEITVEELRAMRAEYEESLRQKQQNDFGVVDLVRFKSLRSDTVCCCIIHFMIFYSYSGPLIAVDQFSADIYINDTIFSLGSLISAIICYYTISNLSRKKLMYYSTIISFMFIVPLYFTSKCRQDCSMIKLGETVSTFIFRTIVQVTYQTFYFVQSQLFPTQVRSLAILVSAIVGNSVLILIPLVADANQTYDFFLPTTFILSGLIIIAATTQVKETVGIPPPQIITELAYTPSKQL